MIIGICGTHRTGKTATATLAAELLSKLGRQVTLLGETTFEVKKQGYKLGKFASREVREHLVKEQLRREEKAEGEVILADATVLDQFAYLLYRSKRRDKIISQIEPIVRKQMQKYDYIFYMPLNKPGNHDPDFQLEVACIIEELFRKWQLKHKKLKGNPEEDAKNIVKTATGYEKMEQQPPLIGQREAFINKKTGHAIIREELRIPQKLLKETYGGEP